MGKPKNGENQKSLEPILLKVSELRFQVRARSRYRPRLLYL